MNGVPDPFAEPEPAPVTRTLRRAARAAPPFVAGVWGTVALAVAGSAALLAGPFVLQRVLDDHATAVGSVDTGAIARLGAVALTIGLLGAAANRLAVQRMLVATAEGAAHLRVAALERLHQLPLQHLQSERRGALVSRVTGDVGAITDFMGWGGVGFLVGLVRVVAALAAITVVQWRIALVLLPLLVAYAVVLRRSQRVLERAHDRVRSTVSTSLGAVGEVVAGLPTLRAHGAEELAWDRVDVTIGEQFRAEVRVGLLAAVLFSSAELFAGALTVAAVVVGVLLGPGVTTVGELVAVLVLVTLLLDPIQTMVETVHEAQAAMAGLRRVLGLLDVPAGGRGRAGVVLPPGPLGLRVRGLDHSYGDGPQVLIGVDADVAPRSHVAVVGATGSGKTTFVKLLARLLDTPSGAIHVGGVPLEDVADDHLRQRVAFVPQEVFLFDATIAENLRHGAPGASDAELTAVLERLGLSAWLRGLPDGLGTRVGERGGQLSAGERQLVALARAALVDPDLLLLDEATSSVDPELEVRLRRAVAVLGDGRTVITVAHRLSTAEAADVVLVFADGRLVERGIHEALVGGPGRYAELHRDWTEGTATSRPA